MDDTNPLEAMEAIANTSNDSNEHDEIQAEGSPKKKRNRSTEAKKQQFTVKQRMDMYAFCVLELETRGDRVSVRKRLQAIKRALATDKELRKIISEEPTSTESTNAGGNQVEGPSTSNDQAAPNLPAPIGESHLPGEAETETVVADNQSVIVNTNNEEHQLQQQQQQSSDIASNGVPGPKQRPGGHKIVNGQLVLTLPELTPDLSHLTPEEILFNGEGEELLKLQNAILYGGGYSAYQKTLVLTAELLRSVQIRFSKYYPNDTVPSKSTIKHTFQKCLSQGCVENIKNPRRKVKIPEGGEVEYLVLHEPQLSLRQMAQKLNVSVGTVARRCKTLGLMPESVALKHQQMAVARRQKQVKENKRKVRSETNE